MFSPSDAQKAGLVMTSFGAFCTGFGILLMMDRGLLALGNVSSLRTHFAFSCPNPRDP